MNVNLIVMSGRAFKYIIEHPLGVFAACVGLAVIIAAVALLIWAAKQRPIRWEQLYYDVSDHMATQMATFGAVVDLIQRHDPTPWQQARPLLTESQVVDRLQKIIAMRPRKRTILDFNFLLEHFNAATYQLCLGPECTEEMVMAIIHGTATPPDLVEHMQNVLAEAAIPNDLSEMTDTQVQRALRP